jgi:hypothetical protein
MDERTRKCTICQFPGSVVARLIGEIIEVLIYRGEDAFFVDTGEGAELFYSNKLVLPLTIPLFYSGQ